MNFQISIQSKFWESASSFFFFYNPTAKKPNPNQGRIQGEEWGGTKAKKKEMEGDRN
jgi:hypothetical protein